LFSGKTGYEVKGTKVSYTFRKHYDHPWLKTLTIKDVDIASFSILSVAYAKDKHRVYFRGVALENSDPQSFNMLAIDQLLDADKNQIYYWGEVLSKDPENFEGLDKHFYRDSHIVWIKKKHPAYTNRYEFIKLTAEEAPSFEVLRKDYFLSRTKTKVFYFEKEIIEADPQSVQTLGGGYWKDKHHYFYQDTPLDQIHKQTFEVLKHPQGYFTLFAKDQDQVFYAGKVIEEIQAKSFSIQEKDGYYRGFDGQKYVSMGGVILK